MLLWMACVLFSTQIEANNSSLVDDCSLFVPITLFYADFESGTGDNSWTFLGGASDGNWQRNTANAYTSGGVQMEIAAFQGSRTLLTRRGNRDVDGGPSVARSPNITIPTCGLVELSFHYNFAHRNSNSSDYFQLLIRRASDNALLQTIVNEQGTTSNRPATWTSVVADLSSLAGETIRIEVRAADLGGDSVIEAAVDVIRLTIDYNPLTEGFVYHDEDMDGIMDGSEPGIGGVIVSVYDSMSNLVATTNSAANGYYSFATLSACQYYTLRFSNFPSGYQESVLGTDNQGSVQHILPGANTKFALYDPEEYCEEDPFLLVPCFVEGSLTGPYVNDAAIVKFRSSADGHDFIGMNKTANYKAQMIATYNTVGTTNGLAYQKTHRKYYAAAYHKRYATFGPAGPDAIYQLSPDGGVLGVLELDALTSTPDVAGADAHDFTVSGNGEIYDLGFGFQSFDAVGKRALGDIEMSGDQNTLYVVNLFNRRIYAIDVTTGLPASSSLITSWATPDPTGAGRHRPFGLAWHNGELWLGTVDENGSNAYIHSLNVQTGVFTLALTVNLNYSRQAFFGNANNTFSAPSAWRSWVTNPNFNPFFINGEIGYPQPMLSDIEFADNGDMILGFRDRFGDQAGADKFFNFNSNSRTYAISSGDILKACFSNGNYTLETGLTGSCATTGGLNNSGPNGYEFYFWDIFALEQNTWNPNTNSGGFHWETAQGGLIQLRDAPYIVTTAMDPYDDFSGGVLKLNNSTGARQGIPSQPVNVSNMPGGYTIFEGGDFGPGLPGNNGLASKANGLGDLEAACMLPIVIGNYVWYDIDKDGIQDANEPPLANVKVQLFNSADSLIGESTTNSAGYYFFGGPANTNLFTGSEVLALSTYKLSISYTETLATPFSLASATTANALSNSVDLIDSDATSSSNGLAAQIVFTTGVYGTTNHSYDFGFVNCPVIQSNYVYNGCQGDNFSIVIDGTTFDESNASGQVTIISASGCDSIVNVDMVFHPEFSETFNYTGCSGDGYGMIINGTLYNESNPSDTLTFNSTNGCDSLIIVNFVYNPIPVVDAGMPNGPLCSNSFLNLATLNATITGGTTTGKWTSTGDGTFNNMGNFGGMNPSTTYAPGPIEIASGVIILTLTSSDPAGPCDPEADAVMILINDLTCSEFPWAGN